MKMVAFHMGPGNVIKETEKAYLVHIGEGQRWFPKSQVTIEIHDHASATMTAPEWIMWEKLTKNEIYTMGRQGAFSRVA